MKKVLSILFCFLFVSQVFSQKRVYTADIEGTIDLGLAPFIKRVVTEAGQNNADLIVFKINTFGGRVDAATQIKDAIIDSKVKTVAFINKRAISAGALISLSCDRIIMVPGSSIGATTVVDQGGNKMSEKAQSYMRAEMRATAERKGRRKDIAEGMVDEKVVVEGLVDSTQLITLTAIEAEKYGMADSILTSTNEILKVEGLVGAEIINLSSNWAEDFIRFTNNSIISSILIMIGLFGLFAEIKSPGWGVPGTAAVIALTIFFGAGYILELASIIEILLFVIGVGLLVSEIFITPGFGFLGIGGILFIIVSLFLGLLSDFPLIDMSAISKAILQLTSSVLGALVLIFILSKLLPKTTVWNRLILQDNINSKSGYTAEALVDSLIGKTGVAYTDLRPSGIILIDTKRFDAVTAGEYILKGRNIKVISEEGSKVVVEEMI